MIVGLDHVQLAAPARCEADARAFYGELLGLREVAKPAALAGRGGVWFALPDGRGLHVGSTPVHAPSAKAHAALRVADAAMLERLAARLDAAGAPVVRDVALPGVVRLHTADPFGNRLELVAPAAGRVPDRSA